MKSQLDSATTNVGRWQCYGCKKDIAGERIQIMNHDWHGECFKCTSCKTPLPYSFYNEGGADPILTYSSARKKISIESNGNPYCEDCYHREFANKCDYCYQEITSNGLKILGKNYHQNHFLCFICKADIGRSKYYMRKGKAVCENCK